MNSAELYYIHTLCPDKFDGPRIHHGDIRDCAARRVLHRHAGRPLQEQCELKACCSCQLEYFSFSPGSASMIPASI